MDHKAISLSSSTCRRRTGQFITLGFASMLGLLVGCSGGAPTGTVKGTVTGADGPPSGAYVNFFDDQSGVGGGTLIGPDGKFAFEQPLPVGQYAVTIVPPSAPPPLGDAAAAAAPPEIPKKFQSAATSELSAAVASGENDFQFTLQ